MIYYRITYIVFAAATFVYLLVSGSPWAWAAFTVGMASSVLVTLLGDHSDSKRISALEQKVARASDTITKDQTRIATLEAKTGFGRNGLRMP